MAIFQKAVGAIHRAVGAVVASVIVAVPGIVLACPVCLSGRDDETQLAFRVSTAAMTFLPFLLVGGLLLWLRKRFRAIAAEEERMASERSAHSMDPVGAPPVIQPVIQQVIR